MKIKIAAILALCVFISGMVGIQGVSATNTSTFYNVDLKGGEYLTAPSFGAFYVKGIQFDDKVALKVRWDDYTYPEQNYTVKVSIGYEDLFGDFNVLEYYFYVLNESDPMVNYLDIPYMDIDKDNMIAIQILPYDPVEY